MLQASVDKIYIVSNSFKFLPKSVEKIDDIPKLIFDYIVGRLFTQMTEEVGIRKHGQVAIDALFKKFSHLHYLEVFEGMLSIDLSEEKSMNDLASINLIKKNRGGGIKG